MLATRRLDETRGHGAGLWGSGARRAERVGPGRERSSSRGVDGGLF